MDDGVEKALLKVLISWVKANSKIEKVCLEVMGDNVAAIELYKKMGFQEEGRKVKAVKFENGYQDLLCMALFVQVIH